MRTGFPHRDEPAAAGRASPEAGSSRARRRTVLFWTGIVAAVIVPFILFGAALEEASLGWIDAVDRAGGWPSSVATAGLVFALLVADLVLPIPSSLVMIAAGAALSRELAIVVCAAGLTGGHLIGYTLGRLSRGSPGPLPPAAETDRAAPTLVALAATRPVPVLAEAMAVAAGRAGLSTLPVLLAIAPANLGFAAICVFLGEAAVHNAVIAGGIIALLALGAFIHTRFQRRRRDATSRGRT